MAIRLIGLVFGAAFGFVLGWARLTDYDVIHDMPLLREPDVFLLMGSAIAVAAIGARLLRAANPRALVGGELVAWSVARPSRDTMLGSVLFGIGWAATCTCPGPAAAQLGRGQWAALFTAPGILAGAALRSRILERRARGPVPAQPAAGPEPSEACAGL